MDTQNIISCVDAVFVNNIISSVDAVFVRTCQLMIGILQSARCAAENSDVGIDLEYVTSILGSACF